jgi:hypothetical protein
MKISTFLFFFLLALFGCCSLTGEFILFYRFNFWFTMKTRISRVKERDGNFTTNVCLHWDDTDKPPKHNTTNNHH